MSNSIVVSIIKEGNRATVKVGAIALSLDLDNFQSFCNNVVTLLTNTGVLDKDEVTEHLPIFMNMLTYMDDIYECEYLNQTMELNVDSGQLLVTHCEMRGCKLDVYKYIALVKSLINNDIELFKN